MFDRNELFNSKNPKDNILCKDCKYKIGKTNYSNNYRKACCAKFEYPICKPYGVLHNISGCTFYTKEKE